MFSSEAFGPAKRIQNARMQIRWGNCVLCYGLQLPSHLHFNP